MRIIFSPTKTMQRSGKPVKDLPVFLKESEMLLKRLRAMTAPELKKLWKCSDEIVQENIQRLEEMNLHEGLSPAVFAFEGIAFKYLGAGSLSDESLLYLQKNMRILSGFYGVLKPFDGVRAYRLDMEHRLTLPGYKNLYDFWGDKIASELRDGSGITVSLASGEYSKAVEKYLQPGERFINCSLVENVKGELKQKATFSKMARGAMLRFMAERQIEDPQELKKFHELSFIFRPELSSETEFIFEHMI